MKRLFLSGPPGCGKTTAIESRLGPAMARCGGFRTQRQQEPFLSFRLCAPDGSRGRCFLEFPDGTPVLHPEVFSTTAVELLQTPASAVLLDEIGGLELLNPDFMQALEDVLLDGPPCIGVVKGPASALALAQRLGLGGAYRDALARLHRLLARQQDTVVYPCAHFDPQAAALVSAWADRWL